MIDELKDFLNFLGEINSRPRIEICRSYTGQSIEIRFFKGKGNVSEYWVASIPKSLFKPEKKIGITGWKKS